MTGYAELNQPAQLLKQPSMFYVALFAILAWDLLLFALWFFSFKSSPSYTGLLMLLFSTVPMLLIGMLVEGREPFTDLMNPRHGSWMFIFGDLIGLPIAGYCLSRYHQTVSGVPEWATSAKTFWGIAIISGLAAAYVFRYMNDASAYTPLAFNSPTKLYHDFGAYVLFFGTLFYGLVYAVTAGLSSGQGEGKWVWLAIASVILLWLAPGVPRDLAGKLEPEKLHVQWDWHDNQVVPY